MSQLHSAIQSQSAQIEALKEGVVAQGVEIADLAAAVRIGARGSGIGRT
jgi:hypothetical protein